MKLPKFYDIVQIAFISLFYEVRMSTFYNDSICAVIVLKGCATCVNEKEAHCLWDDASCHFYGLNRACKENRHKLLRDSDSSR